MLTVSLQKMIQVSKYLIFFQILCASKGIILLIQLSLYFSLLCLYLYQPLWQWHCLNLGWHQILLQPAKVQKDKLSSLRIRLSVNSSLVFHLSNKHGSMWPLCFFQLYGSSIVITSNSLITTNQLANSLEFSQLIIFGQC